MCEDGVRSLGASSFYYRLIREDIQTTEARNIETNPNGKKSPLFTAENKEPTDQNCVRGNENYQNQPPTIPVSNRAIVAVQ